VALDVTAPGADLSALDCDYLVANGLFTVRHSMSNEDMRGFLEATVRAAWGRVRRGLAFNVMSRHVDWQRDDLFHASMDDMAALLHSLAGRRVRIRADYGLYEFTCLAWRSHAAPASPVAPSTPTPADAPVRVLRPQLPRAEALLPYLREIDGNRLYSNFGPLEQRFEQRLGAALGAPAGGVVCASNGTSALVAAILAEAGRATVERPFALMPAYTFVATAVAAQECGYAPWLADVSATDWMLDPGRIAGLDLSRVGVVVVVSAYGRAVPQAPWVAFAERTGIPVLIDGAACFESAAADPATALGPLPLMLSLHATKSLASGEGGAVASTDPARIARIGQALNFGFHHSRDSRVPSTNGKMSEYHAAVGLADLDDWPRKQAAFASVHAAFRAAFDAAGLSAHVHGAPQVCSSYLLLDCGDDDRARAVQDALRDAGVEYRHWYGLGLHRQSFFADCAREPLPVTDALAPRLIGLPMAPDLDSGSVARVVAAVASGWRA
jgi:dTDP-4-amino-4,6-dideoxygalactose transaminase